MEDMTKLQISYTLDCILIHEGLKMTFVTAFVPERNVVTSQSNVVSKTTLVDLLLFPAKAAFYKLFKNLMFSKDMEEIHAPNFIVGKEVSSM